MVMSRRRVSRVVIALLVAANLGLAVFRPRSAIADEGGCVFSGTCECINPGTKGGICSNTGSSGVSCNTQAQCTDTTIEG